MHQGIDPELTDIVTWIMRIINSAQVGAYIEAMFDTTYCSREASASVCKCNFKIWIAFENSSEYHTADCS
ncbi:hypothetical protein D3C80_1418840 [compost metagenome]